MPGSAARTFSDPYGYQTFIRDTQHRVIVMATGAYRAKATAPIMVALALMSCSQQPQVDLNTALSGIEKSRFLTCSGPPSLDMPQGNQENMWFVSNLSRGQAIGVLSPTANAPDSCSVAAVFENSHLVSATFSGNQSMCQVVFAPCMSK